MAIYDYITHYVVSGSLTTIVLSLIVVWIAQWIWDRRQKLRLFHDYEIPGPRPHLVVGNNGQLRKSSKQPYEIMDQWQEDFGETYGYYVGAKPYLVVKNLDMVQQVLIKNFHNFTNRQKMALKVKPVMDTLVGLRGQRWKDVRNVLTPTFSMIKMKLMFSVMNRAALILVDVLGQKLGESIDFYATYQGLTCEVIGECALAMKVDSQRNPDDQMLNSIRKFLLHAMNPSVELAIYFPILARLMTFISNKFATAGSMTNTIIEHVQSAISYRRANPSTEHQYVDVLQLMLDAAESRDSNGNRLPVIKDKIQKLGVNLEPSESDSIPEKIRKRVLSDDEIIANAWVFLLGGFETTANALTYCSYCLAMNPDIQEKLYHEIKDAVGEEENFTYEKIQSLEYLEQVFCESLRLFPPVVLFVIREVAEATQIGSYSVPAGVNVQIPIWQIHHDANLWPDPFRFEPERFEPENRRFHHPMSWIPFGAGPRNCVGMRFALLEAKITIARLLLNYRLEPCDKTEEKISIVVPTVTLNPKNGVHLKAVAR